jgi:hypothetical protein
MDGSSDQQAHFNTKALPRSWIICLIASVPGAPALPDATEVQLTVASTIQATS